VTEPRAILAGAKAVLVLDWPSRAVPESLVKAGLSVSVKSGPGPADYTVWEMDGDDVTIRDLGRAPARADLVYFHRPLTELPAIITLATRLGAGALWHQSGLAPDGTRAPDGCWVPEAESAAAHAQAAAAGLGYVDSAYIADVAGQS
jgi:hypothetical protein